VVTLVASAVVVAAASAAHAASSTLDVAGTSLVYSAPPGVTNNVTFQKLAAPADTYAVSEVGGATISSSDPACWHPVVLDLSTMHCTAPGLVWLRVMLGDGNDTAVNNTDRQIRLDAGAGNDVITIGGRAGVPSYVFAGDGRDSITSGPGDDFISGQAGSDTVRYTGLSAVNASLVTNIATRSGDTDTFSGVENLIGAGGSDTLIGDDLGNLLDGGSVTLCIPWCFTWSGEDTIDGNGGKDVLYGRGSSDTIYGGPGNDAAWGGTADDYLFGEAGDDYLNGEALGVQYNEADGGPGWDTCISTEQINCEVVG
jgi:Ca2+-binding RTX toxin-like protein